MTKELTLNEIEGLYLFFQENWDQNVQNISLNIKQLYNLIGLKKKVTDIHIQTQEAVKAIMIKNGAQPNENGMLVLETDEQKEQANKDFFELSLKVEKIDFEQIEVTAEDNMPSKFVEVLYDFIILK